MFHDVNSSNQIMAELEALLQQEIPNGRKALLDGKVNLENVANYCQQLYVDVSISIPLLKQVQQIYIVFFLVLYHLLLYLVETRKCHK